MLNDSTLKHLLFLENQGRIKIWRGKDGQPHRVGAPAIIETRVQHEEWLLNGGYHRTDGPAIYGVDLRGPYQWWWVNNVRMNSWSRFQAASECSGGDIIYLKLKYGNWGLEIQGG